MIVVEGPDCSGKTSLARRICQLHGHTYMHMSGAKELHPVMPEYHSAVLDCIEWNVKYANHDFVLDRSWPSEFVYGREFRPQLVDRFPFLQFQRRLEELNAIYIFCMDDDVESRFASKHESDTHRYDRGQFHNIVIGYQVLMESMQNRVDYFRYDLKEQGSRLDKFIVDLLGDPRYII